MYLLHLLIGIDHALTAWGCLLHWMRRFVDDVAPHVANRVAPQGWRWNLKHKVKQQIVQLILWTSNEAASGMLAKMVSIQVEFQFETEPPKHITLLDALDSPPSLSFPELLMLLKLCFLSILLEDRSPPPRSRSAKDGLPPDSGLFITAGLCIPERESSSESV